MKMRHAALLILLAATCLSAAAQQTDNRCPTVKIKGPSEGLYSGMPLELEADIGNVNPGLRPTFNWSVSAGTISDGQGTSKITIDTTGLFFTCLTVTVELAGLPADCPHAATWTSLIGTCCVDLRIFDEYGNISFKEERPRLDNVADQLKTLTGARIHIYYRGRKGLAAKRAERAKNYLIKRHGIEAGLILVTDSKEFYGSDLDEGFSLTFYIEPIPRDIPCNQTP